MTAMDELQWRTEVDDDDLTEWSASSIFHDDGSHFMFRIKEQPIGGGFMVRYIETSDAELMIHQPRTWESLQTAMEALQSEHNTMIEVEQKLASKQ